MNNSIKKSISVAFGVSSIVASILVGLIFIQISKSNLSNSINAELALKASSVVFSSPDEKLLYSYKKGEQPLLVNFIDKSGKHLDEIPSESKSDDFDEVSLSTILSVDKIKIDSNLMKLINDDNFKYSYKDIQFEGFKWRILIKKYEKRSGFLIVGKKLSEYDKYLDQLYKTIILISFLFFLLSTLLGFFVAKFSLRGLYKFSAELRFKELGNDGNMFQKVNDHYYGEVGDLKDNYNALIEKINNQRKREIQLLEDVSHELKTPLTSILTNAQLLNENLSKNEKKKRIKLLETQALELRKLTNNILLLNDSNTVTMEYIDVYDFLKNIKYKWKEKNVKVRTENQGCKTILSNSVILNIIIDNLIDNAIKFSKKKIVDVKIYSNGEKNTISVRDYGQGVDEEELVKIFDRFYRPISSHKLPGSGLGLSIDKELSNRINAEIFALNLVDGFEIRIETKIN